VTWRTGSVSLVGVVVGVMVGYVVGSAETIDVLDVAVPLDTSTAETKLGSTLSAPPELRGLPSFEVRVDDDVGSDKLATEGEPLGGLEGC
jgi:hypothetical protein